MSLKLSRIKLNLPEYLKGFHVKEIRNKLVQRANLLKRVHPCVYSGTAIM